VLVDDRQGLDRPPTGGHIELEIDSPASSVESALSPGAVEVPGVCRVAVEVPQTSFTAESLKSPSDWDFNRGADNARLRQQLGWRLEFLDS
jgi:hypothetical protein